MSTPLKLLLLFVGAVAMALASRSLYISMAGPAEPKAEETIQIRIAADALPAGLLLRNDDLDWRSVPRSKVPAGAVVENDSGSQDITGVMVRRDIRAGAPILERDVIRPSSPGFLSAVLKPGMWPRCISRERGRTAWNVPPPGSGNVLLTSASRMSGDASGVSGCMMAPGGKARKYPVTGKAISIPGSLPLVVCGALV